MIAGGGPAGIKKSSLVSSQVQQSEAISSYNYSFDNNTKQFLPAQEQLRLSMK